MNAHDRRKESRRRHMELPLGKEVRIGALLGRRVYAYGSMSCTVTIHAEALARIASAKVARHVRCSYGGLVDLELRSHEGKTQCIATSMRGLRLVNPADRAPRPWWVETLRKHKSQALSRRSA